MLLDNILSSDAFTPVNKRIAKKFGFGCAGYLGELIRQRKRFGSEVFYFTQSDMKDELGLGASSQMEYVKILKEEGFIDVVKKGIPCKNHYTINDKLILEFIIEAPSEATKTSARKNRALEVGKTEHKGLENAITYSKNENKNENKNESESVSTVLPFPEKESLFQLKREPVAKLTSFGELEKEVEKMIEKKEKASSREKAIAAVWFYIALTGAVLVKPRDWVSKVHQQMIEGLDVGMLLEAMRRNEHNKRASGRASNEAYKGTPRRRKINYLVANFKASDSIEKSLDREMDIVPTVHHINMLEKIKFLFPTNFSYDKPSGEPSNYDPAAERRKLEKYMPNANRK